MNVFFKNRKIILNGLLSSSVVGEIDFDKFKQAEGLYIADPWKRVKSIFAVDEYGNFHPELIYAYKMTQTGAIAGGIFGGFLQAMKDTNKFLRTNDTQIFANVKEANKALRDVNILAFGKGAFKWAPTFALFCGGFTFISSCCELYYNEHKVISYTIAGTSIGILFKVSFGIKGMISGGLVGGILGTMHGLALYGMYKITNTNHMQFKYAHFAYSLHKKQSEVYKNKTQSIYDNPSLLPDFDTSDGSKVEGNLVQSYEEVEKNKQ